MKSGLLILFMLFTTACRPVTLPSEAAGEGPGRAESISARVQGNCLSFQFSAAEFSRSVNAGRSITGLDDSDISTGSYCNIFQLISVDAADPDKAIWDFCQTAATNAGGSYQLQIQVRRRHSYNILFLGGYRAAGTTDEPVLLIAGFVRAKISDDTTSIAIPLFTMVTDIKFLGSEDGSPGLTMEPVKGETLNLDCSYNWTAVFSMTGLYGDNFTPLKMAEQSALESPVRVNSTTLLSLNDGSMISYRKTGVGTITSFANMTSVNGQSMQLDLGLRDLNETGTVALDLYYSPFAYGPTAANWTAKYGEAADFTTPLSAQDEIPVWHIKNDTTTDASGTVSIQMVKAAYNGNLVEVVSENGETNEYPIPLAEVTINPGNLAQKAFDLLATGSVPYKGVGAGTAIGGRTFRVYLPDSESMNGVSLSATTSLATIYLQGVEETRTLNLNDNNPLFTLNTNIHLVLEGNITLDIGPGTAPSLLKITGASSEFTLESGTLLGVSSVPVFQGNATWGADVNTGYINKGEGGWRKIVDADSTALPSGARSYTTDVLLARPLIIESTDLSRLFAVPVSDVASQNTISPDADLGFTASILWSSQPYVEIEYLNPGEAFSPRTVYTATVYFTANDDYVFLPTISFTYNPTLSHPFTAQWLSSTEMKAYITFNITATDSGGGPEYDI